MLLLAQILFWSSLLAVGYAYVVYPVLIYVCARLWGQRAEPPGLNRAELPMVSILVSALNEEEVIGERIENALALDYPPDRLEMVVASDGSTDRTAEIVRSFAERFPGRVQLIDFAQRRGKATVLNEILPQLRGEIVLLSDANTFFEPGAVSHLVRWFADAEVGAVCGKLVLHDPVSGRNVDGLYWRYETFIKNSEGRLQAMLGANGAIYAIRRTQFVPIASNTILDDFTIPLLMKIEHGTKVLYDSHAIAVEETPLHVRDEFRRRVRIGTGGYQSITRLWRLLLPLYGWTTFAFWSHKILRWSCPLLMLVALVTNMVLARQAPYQYLLAMQVAFYVTALAGLYLPGNSAFLRLVRLTTMFVSMNLALGIGFVRWLLGRQRGTWQRTARTTLPASV